MVLEVELEVLMVDNKDQELEVKLFLRMAELLVNFSKEKYLCELLTV